LSEFIEKVRDDRESWGTKPFKGLWFRGESKKHPSDLRPKLYRPRENKALKPIPDILEIENRLYEEFQPCGVQLCLLINRRDCDVRSALSGADSPKQVKALLG
jgi:hypothetical protein